MTDPACGLAPEAVARVLDDDFGVRDADLAYLVHDLTAGWPALVQFAGEAISRGAGRSELLGALSGPGTAAATWIQDEVLAALPPQATRQLERIGDFDPVSAELAVALSGGRSPDGVRAAIRRLVGAGLLTDHPQKRDDPGTYRVVPVLAAVLARRPAAKPAAARLLRTAAAWYAENGHPLAAARALADAGDHADCARLIGTRGDEILASGGAAGLIRVIEALPEAVRTDETRLMLGDAHRMCGDVTEAQHAFAPLLDRAGAAPLPPRLRWRVAMLDYLRADYRAALDRLDPPPSDPPPSGRPPSGLPPSEGAAGPAGPDDIMTLVWRSSTLAHLGRADEAAACADQALRAAAATQDDRTLAAAHVAAALSSAGVRRDDHLNRALDRAERAGDVVQQTRILINQADLLLRGARYPQALAVAERAVRTAEAAGPPGMLVTALNNAGEALIRLGRFDQALLSFERSLRICLRVGLGRAATALWGVAEVNRRLGRVQQSRVAFEEAAELARATAEVQTLVPVLIGSSRLLLAAGDSGAARAAADEAERVAPAAFASCARTARGWVALVEGDVELATARMAQAVESARASRQADALAEALELAAALHDEPGEARAALREAAEIWRQAGAELAADQVLVRLGRLPGADAADRAEARASGDRLRARGVPELADTRQQAGAAASVPPQIRVLGPFEVLVGGQPVPLPAWRSRQARTLLKILIARRGRPVRRTELCEILWPDDEPQRTAHRLSVLLSAVRTVLDPMRLRPADHYVRADVAGVSLDLTRVSVDAEDLLRDVAHGVRLVAAGEPDRALVELAGVDAAYRGDAFDDEMSEEWADALRELVRAGWLRALRELARLHRRAGQLDQAVTVLVRLLAADPCDESAHRALVEVLLRARRHGEARRAYGRWVEAMRAIDAPAPDPAVLNRPPADRPQQAYAVAGGLKV